MSTLDFNAELAAAGANVHSRWGAVRFFIRRYPLGAIGAVIMSLFVMAAVFAPLITVYDPLTTNAAVQNFTAVNAANYTFNLVASNAGVVAADIPIGVCTNAFGFINPAAHLSRLRPRTGRTRCRLPPAASRHPW